MDAAKAKLAKLVAAKKTLTSSYDAAVKEVAALKKKEDTKTKAFQLFFVETPLETAEAKAAALKKQLDDNAKDQKKENSDIE